MKSQLNQKEINFGIDVNTGKSKLYIYIRDLHVHFFEGTSVLFYLQPSTC